MESRQPPMERMEVFRQYVAVADWCWHRVERWSPFSVQTIGRQLVRAIDSVSANLVEGAARRTNADSLHFFVIALGSARETRYWIERAAARDLISAEESAEQLSSLTRATRMLCGLIRFRRAQQTSIRESTAEYQSPTTDELAALGADANDPFED